MAAVSPDIRANRAHRGVWWWGAVVLTAAVFLQIVTQAESAGQVIRTMVLGADPAALFFGPAFELALSGAILGMFVAGLFVVGRRRGSAVRRQRPIAYWTFVGGIALQVGHVAMHAADLSRATPVLDEPAVRGLVLNPHLLHFEFNLLVLVAVSVGLIGFRAAREPIVPAGVADRRAAQAKANEAEALMNVAGLARIQGRADEARAMYTDALGAARASGDHRRLARAFQSLGEMALVGGDHGSAVANLREVVEIADLAASLEEDGVRMHRVAERAQRGGDHAGASVARWRRVIGTGLVDAETVSQCLAEVARADGRDDASRAAVLYGAVETLRTAMAGARGGLRPAGERKVTGASFQASYPEAWERGRSMPPLAALRFALEGRRSITL